MAYQFSDLKTKLQTQIGDPNLSDSVAGDALNYAEQSIFNTFALTLNSDQTTRSVLTGTNTISAVLPTDFQKIVNMRITTPAALAKSLKKRFIPVDDFRENFPAVTGSGAPDWWTYWTTIEFSTLADQDYTLTIDYTKSVDIMTTTSDVPTIPQSFEELLVLGAKIRIYEQKEDFDYASQYVNRYADLLEAFTTRYSMQQVDIQGNVPGSRVRV